MQALSQRPFPSRSFCLPGRAYRQLQDAGGAYAVWLTPGCFSYGIASRETAAPAMPCRRRPAGARCPEKSRLRRQRHPTHKTPATSHPAPATDDKSFRARGQTAPTLRRRPSLLLLLGSSSMIFESSSRRPSQQASWPSCRIIHIEMMLSRRFSAGGVLLDPDAVTLRRLLGVPNPCGRAWVVDDPPASVLRGPSAS